MQAQAATPAIQPAPVAPAQPAEGDVSALPQWAQTLITNGQTATQQATIQTAVYRAAAAAGADPVALLDSSAAMAALGAVNVNDPAALTAAIQAAVTANPHIAARVTGPIAGGVDFGATGGNEVTPAQFAAMDYGQRVALHESNPETYRRLVTGR
ncbi:hypothetical protein E4K10_18190 [Streptomyces sp. T1317-0309]|nr:hypothetical protein E4K10_18190 [Streptomyces sp. T1317-0309]